MSWASPPMGVRPDNELRNFYTAPGGRRIHRDMDYFEYHTGRPRGRIRRDCRAFGRLATRTSTIASKPPTGGVRRLRRQVQGARGHSGGHLRARCTRNGLPDLCLAGGGAQRGRECADSRRVRLRTRVVPSTSWLAAVRRICALCRSHPSYPGPDVPSSVSGATVAAGPGRAAREANSRLRAGRCVAHDGSPGAISKKNRGSHRRMDVGCLQFGPSHTRPPQHSGRASQIDPGG